MQDVNIYIETSIHGPARNDGEYLYILECKRGKTLATREGKRKLELSTENQLALTALAEALNRLNCPCELKIHTSCQYILNSVQNGWVKKWQRNGWKSAKGTEVKNAKLWEAIMDCLDGHLYKFTNERHAYQKWMEGQVKTKGRNQRLESGRP